MKKNLLVTLNILLISLLQSQIPSLSWVKQFGSIGNDGVNSMHKNGTNLYVAGWFEASVDLDPGPGVSTITATGLRNVYIADYDLSGNFLWGGSQCGNEYNFCKDISTDNSGNLYTTGYFTGVCDFDPGPGTYTLSATTGSAQSYVCKLSAQGSLIWVKTFGGCGGLYGSSGIDIDASGDCYVTGIFDGSPDFDPGAGSFSMTASASNGAFVLKLDGNGNFIWASQFTGTGISQGVSLALDASGNPHLAGNFSNIFDCDPGPATYSVVGTGTPAHGTYVVKLNPSGTFIWGKTVPGWASDIDVTSNGNIYLAGSYDQPGDFDPGPATFTVPFNAWTDIYVVKLDNAGNFLWCDVFGGSQYDAPNHILSDFQEDLYVTGEFRDVVDFDPGPGNTSFNSGSQATTNGFALRLSSGGQLHWAVQITGTNVACNALAIDNSGGMYIGSLFSNTADFDPGPGTQTLSTISGYPDAYILRMQYSGPLGILDIKSEAAGNIWPNPFTSQIYISDLKEKTLIELISSDGKVIRYLETKEKEINLNTDELPKGVYFISLSNGKNKSYKKLVK